MEYWGHTSYKTKKIFYTWTIENYGYLQSIDLDTELKSSQFPNEGDGVQFYLSIDFVCDQYKKIDRKISFHTLANKSSRKGGVQFYLKKRSKDCKMGELFAIPSAGSNTFRPIERERGRYDGRSSPLDNLIIHCEITLIGDRVDKSGQPGTLITVPNCKLAEDLGDLLYTEELADVKIITADGQMIPVHKAILSARSKVFAAMFKHSMKENAENCFVIIDFNGDVVSEMIRFIYTGKAPNLEEMSVDLLRAADKYELDRLKAMCAKSMGDSLYIETTESIGEQKLD